MANKQRGSTSELERDSGFSDASSEYLSAMDQTEYEDMGFHTRAAKNIQLVPQIPPMTGSYQGVSNMFIMNNVVLQQPYPVTPSLKPWGFSSSPEMVPQSPLVFLQPGIPSGNCTYQCPPNQQRQSKNENMNSFLNTTSHLAHGGKRDHKRSSSYSHGGRHRLRHRNDKRLAENSSVYPQTLSHNMGNMNSENFPNHQEPSTTTMPFSLCTNSFSFPKCSGATLAVSDEVENFPEELSPSISKRKRFCNTYNILNQSGLLGITLRTKELIRQNKHSQAQLHQLQAHTALFLEAINSRDPEIWTKLQLTLQNTNEESKEDLLGNAVCCM